MTVSPALESKQIWFLTGSQGLYGQDIINQVEANSRDIAAQLDAAGSLASRIIGSRY
jgi:L-arabinose isomerase